MAAQSEELWKEALAANQAFHFTIYQASDNDVLVCVLENLGLLSGPFFNLQYPMKQRGDRGINPHVLIIEALDRRAPAEVGEHVVRDIREGSYVILENLRAATEEKASGGRRTKRG